mmetsp:Transcript_15439/g.36465  ORF Transcript_15439/g.36465 Transcript_15439/m.36465 type:complete len:95 (+) Transcript_15439:163-447(+)
MQKLQCFPHLSMRGRPRTGTSKRLWINSGGGTTLQLQMMMRLQLLLTCLQLTQQAAKLTCTRSSHVLLYFQLICAAKLRPQSFACCGAAVMMGV